MVLAGVFAFLWAALLLQRFCGTCLCEHARDVGIVRGTVSWCGARSHLSIQRPPPPAGNLLVGLHISPLAAARSPLGRIDTPSGPRPQAATQHASGRVEVCGADPSLRCWGSHCFLQSLRRAGEMTAALHQVAAPAAAPCDPLVWAWFRRGWPVRGGRLLLPRRPLPQGRHACHRKRANHQGSAKIVKDTLTVTRILGSSAKMRVESGAPLHEV